LSMIGSMFLNMGGDDITEFLYVLLQKINFPYRDMDLARSYNWNVMEDLKARLCTLAEVGLVEYACLITVFSLVRFI
jgi:hypothetical protein